MFLRPWYSYLKVQAVYEKLTLEPIWRWTCDLSKHEFASLSFVAFLFWPDDKVWSSVCNDIYLDLKISQVSEWYTITTVSRLPKCKHYLTVPFSVHSSTKEDSSVMYVLADAELIPDSSLILDPSSNVVDPNQMDDK